MAELAELSTSKTQKTPHRGRDLVEWFFVLTAVAYNLIPDPKASACRRVSVSGVTKMTQSPIQCRTHGARRRRSAHQSWSPPSTNPEFPQPARVRWNIAHILAGSPRKGPSSAPPGDPLCSYRSRQDAQCVHVRPEPGLHSSCSHLRLPVRSLPP
jgi:hypothetical protein